MDGKAPTDIDDFVLLYDGDCPACSIYGCSIDVVPDAGTLRRIDARSDDALVRAATAAGLDLDDGMVVVHRGKMHHGADALHLLARLAPGNGAINRLNRLLFKSPTVARLAYPVLRAGRNLLLRLRGKAKIGNIRHD